MRKSISQQFKQLWLDPKQQQNQDNSEELLNLMADKWATMDVFTNTDKRAEVVSLSKNRTSLERNEKISFPANVDEDSIIYDIIKNPSTDKKEILIRQQLFSFLLSNNFDIGKMRELKNNSDKFRWTLKYLWGVDRDERKQAERERRKAKRRITILKEDGKLISENIAKVKKLQKQKEKISREDYMKYIGYNSDLLSLLNLKKKLQKIDIFIKELLSVDNSIIQDLAIQLQTIYTEIHFPSVEYFIDLYLNNKEDDIDKLFTQAENIYNILCQLWALFVIARKIEEDNYTKVTIDESQPISFKQAWQFQRKKIIEERDKPDRLQVLNDSMDDVYCNTLVGDIMSGKSFQWELNQQLHICAQAIGYAPASQANVHIFHRFISIDRALTDSGKGLSAFGEDITNILEGIDLSTKSGKTFLFLDEWGSTTSPEDQALLLKALLTYMQGKDIKIILATHNEEFVKYIQDNSDFQVYHLKTELNKDGTVDFQHTLARWVGKAHILEAAQTLGLPKNIHDIATRYMKNDIVRADIPQINIPKLRKYTPEEREEMKKESKGFMTLMPYGDEIKIHYKETHNWRTDTTKKIPVLKYRYSLDHYDVEDNERGRKWAYKPEEKPDYDELMTIVSEDNEMARFHPNWLKIRGNQGEIWRFIRDTASKKPEEIFETQKLFEELMKADTDKLRINMVELGSFLFYISNSMYTIRDNVEDFNIYLLVGVYSEVERQSLSDRNFMRAFNIFLAVLKLNNILLWDEADDFLASQLELLEKIKEIDKNVNKLNEELHTIYIKMRDIKQEWKEKEKKGGETQSEIDERTNKLAELEKKDKLLSAKKQKMVADMMKLIDRKTDKEKDDYRDIMDIVYKETAKKLYDHTSEIIKPVNLFEIDINVLKQLLDEVEDSILKYDFLFDDSIRFVCAMRSFLSKKSNFSIFTNKLRKIDSIYTHQFANYLDNILSIMFWDIKNGNDILQLIENSYIENIWKEGISKSRIGLPFWMNSLEKFRKELFNFQTLTYIADMIKENNLCKVDFNESGEIFMEKPYNPNEKEEDQVKNNFYFGKNNRAVIKTGANMSGKTKSLKQTIWPIVFAQSIWYAPAKSMSCPLVSQLLWIDRIKARQNLNLSAGGTEVIVRKEIFEKIWQNNGLKVWFFDEMWSTIPPSYQTPMTYATVLELIQRWLYIDISHHNHQFIEDFVKNHPEIAEAVHFKTNIQEDGTVTFDYLLEKGHTKSQALLVAKTLGMLQEVLDIADEIG